MISGRDIIIVGQQPWDTAIGSNCKNIALEFSKKNRVLYVNHALDRITRWRNASDTSIRKRIRINASKKDALEHVCDNLWVLFPHRLIESINWLKTIVIYNFFNRINNERTARSIKEAIKELQLKDIILFNDGDMFRSFYLKDLLRPALSVYYSRDNLLATDYYKPHGTRLEPLLIKNSDVCVANSVFLKDYCARYNARSYYVGQGCEPMQDGRIPADISTIKGVNIGYVGALLSARLDIEAIVLLANHNLSWQVILVGPEDEDFKNSVLHQLSNVHFLGAKAPEELADHITAFDVCINPQLLNQLTVGNYPRKVDEYLLLGKPVVATRTKAMEPFANFVYLADAKEQYPELIERALRENNASLMRMRKEFAAQHTWENSVAEVYKALEMVLGDLNE